MLQKQNEILFISSKPSDCFEFPVSKTQSNYNILVRSILRLIIIDYYNPLS